MKRMILLSTLTLLLAVTMVLIGSTESAAAQAQLYEAAKKEGEVKWISGLPPERFKGCIDYFQKKYPGIKVSMVTVRGTDSAGRIIMESTANALTADILLSNMQQQLPLYERGLATTVPNDVWKINNVDMNRVLLNNRFVSMYIDGPVWMYNPNLVKPADIPKTYLDLAKPMFKGRKIATTASGTHWGALFQDWKTGKKEKVIDFLKKLREQDPLIAQSLVGIPNMVASSEVQIGVTFFTTYISLPPMAPVKLCPITPVYHSSTGIIVIKNAPHPNAAQLLASWLASPEAGPILRDTAQISPVWPCDAGPAAKALCDVGIRMYGLESLEDIKLMDDLGLACFEAMGWKPG